MTQEYTLQDAIRDAIAQQDAAGEGEIRPASAQQAVLDALSRQPTPASEATMREAVIEAIKQVYDPELPVNLYDLGLIYTIDITSDFDVHIHMTLTAPGCPVAGEMPRMVERAVRHVNGVGKVTAKLVWDPPWEKSMMSEAAQLELGFM